MNAWLKTVSLHVANKPKLTRCDPGTIDVLSNSDMICACRSLIINLQLLRRINYEICITILTHTCAVCRGREVKCAVTCEWVYDQRFNAIGIGLLELKTSNLHGMPIVNFSCADGYEIFWAHAHYEGMKVRIRIFVFKFHNASDQSVLKTLTKGMKDHFP